MNEQEKNKLINRILSDHTIIGEYTIRPASHQLKYRADLYYEDIYNKFKYDEIPLREQLFLYLVNFKFIEPDYKGRLETMRNSIDNLKEWLYLAGPKVNEEKELRKKLKIMNGNLKEVGLVNLLGKSINLKRLFYKPGRTFWRFS